MTSDIGTEFSPVWLPDGHSILAKNPPRPDFDVTPDRRRTLNTVPEIVGNSPPTHVVVNRASENSGCADRPRVVT